MFFGIAYNLFGYYSINSSAIWYEMQQQATIGKQIPFSFDGFSRALRFAAIFGLLVGSAQAANLPVAIDQTLPKTGDQRLIQYLKTHSGKPVLINFWATWCEPCREEMPSMQRMVKRLHDAGLDILVVTVSVADNKKKAEKFLQDTGLDFPVIYDPEQTLTRSWRASVLPTTLILDRKHRIRFRVQGAIEWDSPEIEQQLQSELK